MSGFFDRINSNSSSSCGGNRVSSFKASEKALDLFGLRQNQPSNTSIDDVWKNDEEEEFSNFSFSGAIQNMKSDLEKPLIERVMNNANDFVRSGENSQHSAQHNNQPMHPRRQKYMPVQKTGMELFDEGLQIRAGPAFNKIFNDKNDSEITVTGGDGKCPIITCFAECQFFDKIYENLHLKKYTYPTQIQKCVIPLIMLKKNDILGHAQTGSGKTAAFVLPIINHIQKLKQQLRAEPAGAQNSNFPYAVVIAPTKELAEQLATDARSFADGTDVRVAVSYGDMPVHENILHIRYGCDIYVTTCGRLVHFVREEIIKLDKLEYLILDEADKLLNDTFLDCIRALKQHKALNSQHRTFMFSATFDDTIQELAREFLQDSYFFVRIGEMNRPADTVEQRFIRVFKYDKQDLLIKTLIEKAVEKRREDNTTYYEVEKTIVFVQHRRQSDRLAIALAQIGFLVISINGDRTLKQRMEAVEKFTKNIYNILVATDVAARGLNFPQVMHVINFDLPEQDPSSYIHRIGRAGRAGNLGRATAFFDPEGEEIRNAGFYVQTLQSGNHPVPKFLLDIYHSTLKQNKELLREYGKVPGENENYDSISSNLFIK